MSHVKVKSFVLEKKKTTNAIVTRGKTQLTERVVCGGKLLLQGKKEDLNHRAAAAFGGA